MASKKRRKGLYAPTAEQAISAASGLAKFDRAVKMSTPDGRMVKSVTVKFDGSEWLVIMRGQTSFAGDDMVAFARLDNLLNIGDLLSTMLAGDWKLDKYGNGWRKA